MDRGAWKAAGHGVTKSWTRLSDFTFTFHFHALEKEMATHSSVRAWRIPGTGEPGGLPSMGSHTVRHDWSNLAAAAAAAVGEREREKESEVLSWTLPIVELLPTLLKPAPSVLWALVLHYYCTKPLPGCEQEIFNFWPSKIMSGPFPPRASFLSRWHFPPFLQKTPIQIQLLFQTRAVGILWAWDFSLPKTEMVATKSWNSRQRAIPISLSLA